MCNLHANIATAEAMRRLFQVSDENDRLGNAPARPAIFPKGEAPELPQWSRKTTKRGSIEDVLGFLRPISSAKDAYHQARDRRERRFRSRFVAGNGEKGGLSAPARLRPRSPEDIFWKMKWAGNIVVLGRHYDIVGLATQAGMPMVVEGERRVLFVLGAGTAGFGSFQSEDRE